MPKPKNPDDFRQGVHEGRYRESASGILREVARGGSIKLETLQRLMELLSKKTKHTFHIELAVNTGALLKTIDNEEDAQETIFRLEGRPDRSVENADVKRET